MHTPSISAGVERRCTVLFANVEVKKGRLGGQGGGWGVCTWGTELNGNVRPSFTFLFFLSVFLGSFFFFLLLALFFKWIFQKRHPDKKGHVRNVRERQLRTCISLFWAFWAKILG